MSIKPVQNTEGEDIAPLVNAAAAAAGVDALHLLALLYAESALNPKAERWGAMTVQAKEALAAEDWDTLTQIIGHTWPDISFGMSQRIVLFHERGNRSPAINNVLAVRAAVFDDPAGDILAAAMRYAACLRHPSSDGTPLSAMVVYNAGADRRNEREWMALWKNNVASYERALGWAEAYREGERLTGKARIAHSLGVLWGWKEALRVVIKEPIIKEMEDAIVAIKEESGVQ